MGKSTVNFSPSFPSPRLPRAASESEYNVETYKNILSDSVWPFGCQTQTNWKSPSPFTAAKLADVA